MVSSLTVNLERIAKIVNVALPMFCVAFFFAGHYFSFYFHFLTVTFFMGTAINFYYRHIQKDHALLANFGWVAQDPVEIVEADRYYEIEFEAHKSVPKTVCLDTELNLGGGGACK